jgi:predicted nucleic acid-binding protein
MPKKFVIDNSIVMSWCFGDEKSEYAMDVLNQLQYAEAFTPAIWPLELGNVLLVSERKKRLDESKIVSFFTLLDGLPINVEQESPERMLNEIFILARNYTLSTYDASYLDLAIRLNLPLATLDQSLIDAAKKNNISLLNYESSLDH